MNIRFKSRTNSNTISKKKTNKIMLLINTTAGRNLNKQNAQRSRSSKFAQIEANLILRIYILIHLTVFNNDR